MGHKNMLVDNKDNIRHGGEGRVNLQFTKGTSNLKQVKIL